MIELRAATRRNRDFGFGSDRIFGIRHTLEGRCLQRPWPNRTGAMVWALQAMPLQVVLRRQAQIIIFELLNLFIEIKLLLNGCCSVFP